MSDPNTCLHNNVQPTINIQRYQDPAVPDEDLGLMMSVGLFCGDCGVAFEFVGDMKPGIGWDGPHRSLDSTLINLPVAPPGEKVADELPSVDFGDPWLGKPDDQIEAMIRRALEAPQGYSPIIPNQGRNAHRAKAIRVALTGLLRG